MNVYKPLLLRSGCGLPRPASFGSRNPAQQRFASRKPVRQFFGVSRHGCSSKAQPLLLTLFTIVSYNPLYFCLVCCNFSFFISNFVDLILLSFFIGESGVEGLSVLFILSKNQLLVLVIFTIVSFIYFSFISVGSL